MTQERFCGACSNCDQHEPLRIAVFCVGNNLYLDDGLGPAVFEAVMEGYDVPENVDISDVGCMSMSMLEAVNDYDVIITVDAVEGTGYEPGTVVRYTPEDMARFAQARTSLHDLRLSDLFDAAALLGYQARGICLGMEIENRSPVEFVIGLTPKVYEALPLLVETLAAELAHLGSPLVDKATGLAVVGPKAGQ